MVDGMRTVRSLPAELQAHIKLIKCCRQVAVSNDAEPDVVSRTIHDLTDANRMLSQVPQNETGKAGM